MDLDPLDDEIRDFIERDAEARVAQGASPEDAQRLARASMGSAAALRDRVAEISPWRLPASMLRDIRLGLRMLLRTPGFTAIGVLTLALGLGAITALFSVASEVLLKPLPVKAPEQLVFFRWHATHGAVPPVSIAGMSIDPVTGSGASTAFSQLTFQEMAASTRSLQGILAFGTAVATPVAGEPRPASGQLVSGNYFQLLGTTAGLGRLLTPDDDRGDAPLVVVISHTYWQRAFGADPGVLGRTMRFDPKVAAIVGVAPAGFAGVGQLGDSPDFFLPLTPGAPVSQNKFAARMREAWVWPFRLFGRLEPGATMADAERELQGVFQSTSLAAFSARKRAKPSELPRLEAQPGAQGLTESRASLERTLTLVGAGAAVLLVIVCVNLTNLLLARADSRRKEMAIRLSIGASRVALIRQLLTESLLMTLAGAAAGALIAYWGKDLTLAWISRVNPSFLLEPRIDLKAFVATIAVAIATGLAVGLGPALRSTRIDPHPALKDVDRAPTGRRAVMGRALLMTQVALAAVLLVAAGLLVRSLRNLETADVGFNPAGLLVFDASGARGATPGVYTSELDAFAERARTLPGVRASAYSGQRLLSGARAQPYLSVPGAEKRADEDRTVYSLAVSPNFFQAYEIPIVAGRPFVASDRGRQVAIVNEAVARRFFGGAGAIGRQVAITKDALAPEPSADALLEIVGVARDAKYETVREDAALAVFLPVSEAQPVALAIRSAVPPLTLVASLRALAASVSPSLQLDGFTTEEDQMAMTFARERHMAVLSSVFGGLALALTSIGLYGLLSYGVARRRREIGVRMALGAPRWTLVRQMLRETLGLVVAGLALGLLVARAGSRVLGSLLFGVSANDPIAQAGAAAVIAAVAVLAAAIPAHRASRVDPLIALRE